MRLPLWLAPSARPGPMALFLLPLRRRHYKRADLIVRSPHLENISAAASAKSSERRFDLDLGGIAKEEERRGGMAMDAANSVTPGAVALILANPSPDSAADVPEIVVQVVDLKPIGTRFTSVQWGGKRRRFFWVVSEFDDLLLPCNFMASDGKAKIKAMLPTHFASEVHSGNLQNLCLICILDYTCNTIPNQSDKALIITKCEVVSQALEAEIKTKVKKEEEPAVLVMSRDDSLLLLKNDACLEFEHCT